MALTAALHGALIRGARGKSDPCTGAIVLESSNVKPYGKIVGKLVLRSDSELKHFGIRIQFEAICNLQFETKIDSRVTFHKKQLSIIPKTLDTDSEGYQVSPILVDVIESRATLSENQAQTWQVILQEQPAPNLPPARPYIMQPGIHNFGFELYIPGDTLPAPFRSPYGSLIYKVVAYIKNETASFVQVADKSVRFPGYHNLALNEEASKPISLERTLKKSVFSSKKFVTASLKLDKSGYLPDEEIPFCLTMINPKLMTMTSVVVSLVQKITYSVSGTSKTTTNTLDTKEYPVKEQKTEVEWQAKLRLKKRQMPTFSHIMYSAQHMIQYKVQVSDYGSIKGDAPIFIGTTRESEEELKKLASIPEPEPKVPKSLKIRRQGSSASTMSTMSAMECGEGSKSPPITPSEEEAHESPAEEEEEQEDLEKKVEELSMSPPAEEVLSTSPE